MTTLRKLFLTERGILRPIWRFVLFLLLYIFGGRALDLLLIRLHYPDRSFTWSGWLWNYPVDFAFVSGIALLLAWISKERFSSYGLPLVRNAGSLFVKGIVWGFIPSALILIPIYFAGGCEFHGLALHGKEFVASALLWAAAMLTMGFTEEITFRGCALSTLAESIGFWPAALFLSSIFGLVHLIFKPHEDWIDPISVALYGVFWCLTLRRTGSLWFAVGFHAASDYADMIVFAEPNSGNDGKPLAGHLLDVRFHGPDWLTGGPRGTEASLLVFLVLAGLFYFFHKAYPRTNSEESASK